MTRQWEKTTTLIYGCDIISKKLTYSLSPMGLMYSFHTNEPRKPRALSISVISIICLSFFLISLWDYSIRLDLLNITGSSPEWTLALKSTFVVLIRRITSYCKFIIYGALYFIPIFQHGPISSIIAQGNYMLTEKEQASLAKRSFSIYALRSIILSCGIGALILGLGRTKDSITHYVLLGVLVNLIIQITTSSPLIYLCYLGLALGRNVANFSDFHIEPLFDQFLKQQPATSNNEIATQNNNSYGDLELQSTTRTNSTSENIVHESTNAIDQNHEEESWKLRFQMLHQRIVSLLGSCYQKIMKIIGFLTKTGYPELGISMEMSKGNSSMKISESRRIENTHLIRSKLRKTQVMLTELRDTVNDINKMSSMLIMGVLIYETIVLVIITTASIQGKVYKSINWIFVPTVTFTIGTTISVVYICLCLDETTSQLKLLINKLFDFIIMNLRVKVGETMNNSNQQEDKLRIGNDTNNGFRPSESISSLASITNLEDVYEREDEEQSETWSQFQYTRKLAGTIHFTMGGILPISKRLVLPTLAHILSAVFISIEIMSIIDTLSQDNISNSNSDSFHDNSQNTLSKMIHNITNLT